MIQSPHPGQQGYRRDIDGLRAVAVLPVVAYHAWEPLAPGGYVGVDVFFVISGFLITSIILADIEAGRFTIARFYERRVRRILPALLAVVVATTLAAAILFMPRELISYGRSLVATLLFGSNIHFYGGTDYFTIARELRPLLHTWSLAVEEQYYIVAPLLLLWLARRGRGTLVTGLAAIAAVSLAASLVLMHWDKVAAFYLAPPRAWELAAGALLAVGAMPAIGSRLVREAVAALGLAAIAVAVFGYSSATAFPGTAALVPVLGAAAILHAGTHGPTLVGRLLSLPVLVFVGLISYSLYLWHWPILTFAEYYLLRALTWQEALAAAALSLVMATASWRFVERPFRRPDGVVKRPALFGTAAAASAALAAVGGLLITTGGLPGRLPAEIVAVTREQDLRRKAMKKCSAVLPDDARTIAGCRLGATAAAAPRFILWGDSHAAAILPGIDALAARAGWQGATAIHFGCAPVLGITKIMPDRADCDVYGEQAFRQIVAARPDRVLLVGRWGRDAEGERKAREESSGAAAAQAPPGEWILSGLIETTVRRLREHGIEVAVLGPVPEQQFNVPSVVGRSRAWNRPLPARLPLARFFERQKEVLAALDTVKSIDGVIVAYPHEALCDADGCRFERDGAPFYVDDDHISPLGAEEVAKAMTGVFAPALRAKAAAGDP